MIWHKDEIAVRISRSARDKACINWNSPFPNELPFESRHSDSIYIKIIHENATSECIIVFA